MACATPPEDPSAVPPPGEGDARLAADPAQADAGYGATRLFRIDPELKPGLYIVSTPIGNLRDITLRALDILASVDGVCAEDTRVTGKLLSAYGVSARLRPYNDHNGADMRPALLEELGEGARLALVSDAGTPLISDPGFKLVRAAIERGLNVVPVPGASAPLAALALSGLPTDRFVFAGFPPPRASARRRFFEDLADVRGTLIFFEGPSRLVESLQDMAATFGPRPACVARELTKKFEEARRGTLVELAEAYHREGPPRGEIVVAIGAPPTDEDASSSTLDALLLAADPTRPLKAVAAEIAEATGAKRRDVYARGLALRRDEKDSERDDDDTSSDTPSDDAPEGAS